jgi:hypothetical protein
MDEVARLADRVAVIVGGSIVAEGTPSSLVTSFGDTRISFCLPSARTITDLPISSAFTENERVVLVSSEPTAALFDLTDSAVFIALVGVTLILGLGVVAYGLDIEAAIPGAMLVFTVGVASFAALGIAVGSMIPSPAAAPAIANGTILPLAFISNVFIPLEDPPGWLNFVGDFFPLKPFVTSFQDAFNPAVSAPAIPWSALGWLLVWGALGVAEAMRYFQWEPNARSPRTKSRD